MQPSFRCAYVALLSVLAFGGPVLAEVTVIGGLTRDKTVQPGQQYEELIFLKNTGEVPAQARIYQTDYLFSADGKNSYGKPGTAPRSNAKWVSLSDDVKTIPPGETVGVKFTVIVPGGKEMTGTYWSMIMVEYAGKPPALKDRGKEEVQLGLRHVMRYGVQIVNHLGGTGEVKVKIAGKSLISEDGRKTYRVDIGNAGDRWVGPETDVWLELFDMKGGSAGKFEGKHKRIYPGTSVRQEFDLTNAAPGKYKGLLVIDTHAEEVHGVLVKLEL